MASGPAARWGSGASGAVSSQAHGRHAVRAPFFPTNTLKTRVLDARGLGEAGHWTVSYAQSRGLGILPLMSTPKYRVHLRWPTQQVSHTTVTEIREVAEFAFEHLKSRRDLQGKRLAVTMTLEGKSQNYYEFDSADAQNTESAPKPPTSTPKTP
jgi:hypothetical protein